MDLLEEIPIEVVAASEIFRYGYKKVDFSEEIKWKNMYVKIYLIQGGRICDFFLSQSGAEVQKFHW